MTKREKIQEAYGKVFEHYTEFIDENGWIKKLSLIPSFNVSNIEFSGLKQRPKSLQGIENNNGWIKIESENDLPKEGRIFWVIKKGYNYAIVETLYQNDSDYWMDLFTHYKSIEIPELPIY